MMCDEKEGFATAGGGTSSTNDVDGARAKRAGRRRRRFFRERRLLKLLLAVALLQPGTAAARTGPSSAAPSTAALRSVEASGLVLPFGATVLRLDSGVLYLANDPQDPVAMAVFLGRGTATFAPKDPVEQRQMMLYTGYPGLREAFSSAVFVLGPGQLRREIGARSAATSTGSERSQARALLNAWKKSPERRILGVEGLLLRAGHADPLAEGAAYALLDGTTLGRFVVGVDPAAEEPLIIGRFKPWDLKGHVRRKVEKMLQKGYRRGWFEAAQLLRGTWSTWTSTGRDGGIPDAASPPPFEVPRMSLDVTLRGSKLTMTVRARVELSATKDGLSVVGLQIPVSFIHVNVTSASGEKLPFVRTPLETFVALPRPLERGATTAIEIAYEMKTMEHPARKAYALSDPVGWLPAVSGTTPETYRLTVHWPRKLQLVTPGTVVQEDRVSKGMRSRTVELRPGSSGMTFAIGKFDVCKDRVGGQEIVVAVDRTARRYKGAAANELLTAVKEIVTALRGPFGPLPFGRLTVVTGQQGLSMSFPGFVLLSSFTMADRGAFEDALGIYGTPEGNLAHEIAHQWLGNSVHPAGYRDAWWAEGSANFVAERIMFARAATRGERPSAGLSARRILPETLLLSDGLARGIMSPPPLGKRLLGDPPSLSEYVTTLYDRGSQVFFLLDETAPSRDLLAILGKIVRRHAGHALSSDTLLREIGTGLALDARRLTAPVLHGSPPPAVVYRFSPAGAAGGKWKLSGSAHLSAMVATSTVHLTGSPRHWAITPRQRWIVPAIRPPLGLPFGIFKEVPRSDALVRKFGTFVGSRTSVFALYLRETATYGTMLLEKPTLRFGAAAPFPPSDFRLDPDAQLPVVTVSQNRQPAYGGLCAGLEEAAAGRMDRAREWFRNVTDLCEHLDPEDRSKDSLRSECVLADMAARVHLGELALSNGEIETARYHLELAQASLARAHEMVRDLELPEPPSLRVLEARIALAAGDAEAARAGLSAIATKGHRPLTPDGYAVLAVAASRTRHLAEAAHAVQAAQLLGIAPSADTSAR